MDGDGRGAGVAARVARGGVPGVTPVGRGARAGVPGVRFAAVGRGRAGAAEKAGVTGAGGRFGALWARGAAENTAAGALVDPAVELAAGAEVIGGWLNGTALGGGEALTAGCVLGAAENTAGGAAPGGASRGVAAGPVWLNAGADAVPAGCGRGVWVAGARFAAVGRGRAGAAEKVGVTGAGGRFGAL